MFPHKRGASGHYETSVMPAPELPLGGARAERSKSNVKSPPGDERELLFSRGKDAGADSSALSKHRATSPLVNILAAPGQGEPYDFTPSIFPQPPQPQPNRRQYQQLEERPGPLLNTALRKREADIHLCKATALSFLEQIAQDPQSLEIMNKTISQLRRDESAALSRQKKRPSYVTRHPSSLRFDVRKAEPRSMTPKHGKALYYRNAQTIHHTRKKEPPRFESLPKARIERREEAKRVQHQPPPHADFLSPKYSKSQRKIVFKKNSFQQTALSPYSATVSSRRKLGYYSPERAFVRPPPPPNEKQPRPQLRLPTEVTYATRQETTSEQSADNSANISQDLSLPFRVSSPKPLYDYKAKAPSAAWKPNLPLSQDNKVLSNTAMSIYSDGLVYGTPEPKLPPKQKFLPPLKKAAAPPTTAKIQNVSSRKLVKIKVKTTSGSPYSRRPAGPRADRILRKSRSPSIKERQSLEPSKSMRSGEGRVKISSERDERTTQYTTSVSLGNQDVTKASGGFFMRSFAAPVSSSIDWATRKKNKRYGGQGEEGGGGESSLEQDQQSKMMILETITDEAELEEQPNEVAGKNAILIEPQAPSPHTRLLNIAESSTEHSVVQVRPENPLLHDLATETTGSRTSTKNFLLNELEAMAVPEPSEDHELPHTQSIVRINTSLGDCSSLEGSFTSELFVKRHSQREDWADEPRQDRRECIQEETPNLIEESDSPSRKKLMQTNRRKLEGEHALREVVTGEVRRKSVVEELAGVLSKTNLLDLEYE